MGVKNLKFLERFDLILSHNGLGENVENVKFLAELRWLKTLKKLKLDLSYNSFGINYECLKYLGIGVKWLNFLDYLYLNLSNNNLEESQ